MTDISIPVANGKLKLEIRRSYTPVKNQTIDLNSYSSKFFGASWSSNLKSRAGIAFDQDGEPVNCYVFNDEGQRFDFEYSSIDSGNDYFKFKYKIRDVSNYELVSTKLVYDRQNQKLIWTKKYGTQYVFKSYGVTYGSTTLLQLEKIVDNNNNVIRYRYTGINPCPMSIEYDEDGDESTPSSMKIDITYNGNDCISSVTDPNGNTWNYEYGANGNFSLLSKVIQPAINVYQSGSQRPEVAYDYSIVETRPDDPRYPIL